MRKTTAIILAVLLLLTVFVSCNHEEIVDEAFTFTITFRGNDPAFDETAIQKIGKGIPIELRDNALKREGYVLVGWNSETDGSGTSYTNGQRVSFDGDITLYAKWAIALTSETTTLTDGNAYSFDRDIVNENRMTVTGNVTLILLDGYTLTSTQGITVNEGNNLTIDVIGNGTGALNAFAKDPKVDGNQLNRNAAIGGEQNYGSGLITINGGTVNATSETFGAAIGGGQKGIGTVTINGGTVNATAGVYGAAIGGGHQGNGTVTINGGTVNATSETYGAALGGGGVGYGFIVINGGTVNATAGNHGAAVGGGWGGGCGSIVVNGGTITATSGLNGAAIGYGYTGPGGGTVVINGGTVTATAGKNGAGIGGCYDGPGVNVTINGGQVLAIGGSNVSTIGIGRGRGDGGNGNLILGEGVSLLVSSDNTNWSTYDGTTRQRYMKTN